MHKITVLFCCIGLALVNCASLYGSNDYVGGFDRNIKYMNRGGDNSQYMSQVDLLRQKFLLDILFKVQEQLKENDILQEYGLDYINVIQGDMFDVAVDEDMSYVIDLTNQCLSTRGRNNYNVIDEQFLREMLGLYRMLVSARDYQTFQNVAIITRKCINTRSFVYALIYAARDRVDTRNLYVPYIYEILPELYYAYNDVSENMLNNFIDYIRRDISPVMSSVDVNKGNKQMNVYGGYMGNMQSMPFWLPFRELQQQAIYQRISGGRNGILQTRTKQQTNKLVLPLENNSKSISGIELFMQDLDLEAYIQNLIYRMAILEKDQQQPQQSQQQQYGDYERRNLDNYETSRNDERSRYISTMRDNYNYYDRYNRLDRNDRTDQYGYLDRNVRSAQYGYLDRNDRYDANNYYGDDLRGSYEVQREALDKNLPTVDVNDERLLYVGRRRMNLLNEEQQNRYANNYGQRQDTTYYNYYDRNNRYERDQKYASYNYGEQNLDNTRTNDRTRYNLNNDRYVVDRKYDRTSYNNERLGVQNVDYYYKNGEIFLHNLRQIIARFNLERYSLGEYTNDQQQQQQRDQISSRGAYALKRYYNKDANMEIFPTYFLNQLRLKTQQQRLLLDYLNQIEQQINYSIQEQQQQQSLQYDINRVIYDVLFGCRGEMGIIQIIGKLQKSLDVNELPYQAIRQQIYVPVLKYFLQRIDQLRDEQTQRSYNIDIQNELERTGVTIKKVSVDKLRTYIEAREYDLVNMLPYNDAEESLRLQKQIRVQQPQLNYKPFAYTIELNSERAQRVVVRTFLGPRDVNVQREDFMLLDAQLVNLQMGKNTLKRSSKDFVWTNRPYTTYSAYYQQVLQAINGEQSNVLYMRDGQSCRYPDNLLLPRGRVNGLPVQLLIIVTSVDDNEMPIRSDNMICGFGVGNMQLDNLPLGFPMDRNYRDIVDIKQLESYQNVYRYDAIIQHDEKLKYDLLA